jgi:hypothetical protein
MNPELTFALDHFLGARPFPARQCASRRPSKDYLTFPAVQNGANGNLAALPSPKNSNRHQPQSVRFVNVDGTGKDRLLELKC